MIGYCSDWSIKEGVVSGRALELAVLVKERKEIFSAFLSGLSSTDEGLDVINYLIEHQIFFDPSFISTEKVDEKTFTKLDKEAVLDTLNINTDLDLLFISSETLKERELCALLSDAIAHCEHPIKVVLDHTEDKTVIELFSSLSPIIIDKDTSDDELIDLLERSVS